MEIIEAIKEKFQVWYLIQRDKYLKKELSKLPSDNQDDYYFDNLTNSFINKDYNLNVQIGWENTLNVVKTKIESLNLQVENLQAIIADIAQVNIDTTALTAVITNIASIDVDTGNLQAIISDIASMTVNVNNLQAIIANINTMNINVNNLQAIITDIANIETLNTTISGNITSLTAIIANINTMNTNISNLQAIISDIANIETLNTTISGNITSLTAIIANIGTMNTNIGNLQAIIADIANIESQQILIKTSLATINTNIGTINTAITNIEGHQVDLDINIESIKDLDIAIVNQENKGNKTNFTLNTGNVHTNTLSTSNFIYNLFTIRVKTTNASIQDIDLAIKIFDASGITSPLIYTNFVKHADDLTVSYQFPASANLYVWIQNHSVHSYNVDIEYIFTYSETTLQQNIILSGIVPVSSYREWGFQCNQLLYNRCLLMIHQASGTLNTVILIKRTMDVGTNFIEINTTYSTGSENRETINMSELNKFSIRLTNNNGSVALNFTILLFFSKKTIASDLNLNDLNEKAHTSLTGILTSQHHVKTVANELNLNNLNEKSYNSLTEKPTTLHRFSFLKSFGRRGFIDSSYYAPTYEVAASDTDAEVRYSYHIIVAGSYLIRVFYATSTVATGSATGTIKIANTMAPANPSYNKDSGSAFNLPLGTANRIYKQDYGNVDLVNNSILAIVWNKNASCSGTVFRIYGFVIKPNF